MKNVTATSIDRRTLLAAAGAAAGWSVIGRVERSAAAGTTPPGFPADIDLHQKVFANWDTTIRTDAVWTSSVTSPEQIVRIANWAVGAGYRVRPRGYGHTWSPLLFDSSAGTDVSVVFVDTTKLTATSMADGTTVRVQAGQNMEALFAYLSRNGRSLAGAPAPGDVTVGGVLAVNGHGTGVPRKGESTPTGTTYGTLSNYVTGLTAVVWDAATSAYALRTFSRTDPDCAALLTHLGRAFITEVTLATVPNYRLRCRATTLIPADTLFAAPERAGSNSLGALLDQHGRVGIIWYAFTEFPWVQTWDVAPTRPLLSRPVFGPYNFPFADNLPAAVVSLITKITQGSAALTPAATEAILAATRAGLTASAALDMWGEARHFINFVKPTTLRVSAASHGVAVRRADVQRLVHDFTSFYEGKLKQYQVRGEYPINNTCEIRITGVDDPGDLGIAGAQTPTLSCAAPVPGRPELDTVVWLDVLTLPNTAGSSAFFAELDRWFRDLPASLGVARPKWAKRFAHTSAGAWTDTAAMQSWIPGQIAGWSGAVGTLNKLDPHGLYRSPLLDKLMPA